MKSRWRAGCVSAYMLQSFSETLYWIRLHRGAALLPQEHHSTHLLISSEATARPTTETISCLCWLAVEIRMKFPHHSLAQRSTTSTKTTSPPSSSTDHPKEHSCTILLLSLSVKEPISYNEIHWVAPQPNWLTQFVLWFKAHHLHQHRPQQVTKRFQDF